MIGIYKITSPIGNIYIGESIEIENRFKNYKLLRCKNQKKLYNSFIKYGVENHQFSIIEICDVSSLNRLERYWQNFYDVLNENGLNLKLTGDKTNKTVHSLETR